MSKKKSGLPYFWVSWLTKLLSGENECRWAAWFKSRYSYDKYDDGLFDSAAWSAEHSEMVTTRSAELIKKGYRVTIEGENDFKLVGETATLAGKPDIVAVKGRNVLIVDCKSGKRRDSDWWQVLIYLFALPKARKDLLPAGKFQLRGEVQYKLGIVADVELSALASGRETQIVKAIMALAGEEARRVPSKRECRYCNIGPADCDDRATDEPHKEAETSIF